MAAKRITPATAQGKSSKALAPSQFRLPKPSAEDVAKVTRGGRQAGGFVPGEDALTKRRSLKTRLVGKAGVPDVRYRSLSGKCEVQRVPGEGWRLTFYVAKGQPAFGGTAKPVAELFSTSDLALNFAARALGLTSEPLDPAGRG